MLVLTRKLEESLMIEDNIETAVLSINHGQVRIGINAPREIPVHQQEVYQVIIRQNQLPPHSSPPSKELLSIKRITSVSTVTGRHGLEKEKGLCQ